MNNNKYKINGNKAKDDDAKGGMSVKKRKENCSMMANDDDYEIWIMVNDNVVMKVRMG